MNEKELGISSTASVSRGQGLMNVSTTRVLPRGLCATTPITLWQAPPFLVALNGDFCRFACQSAWPALIIGIGHAQMGATSSLPMEPRAEASRHFLRHQCGSLLPLFC